MVSYSVTVYCTLVVLHETVKNHNHRNTININPFLQKTSTGPSYMLSHLCLFGVCHLNKVYLKRCEQRAVLSGHFVFWASMVHWADDTFPAHPVSKACPLFCKKATFSIMKCKNQSTRTRVECNLTPSIFSSWEPV